MRMRTRTHLIAAVLVALAAVAGYAQESVTIEVRGNRYEVLIESEYPRDGYDRDNWDLWDRVDGTRFNVRDQVLSDESLVPVTVNEGSSYWRTRVISGEWQCLFSGAVLTESREVDVDHVVPLAEAYDSGAHAWSEEQKREYANSLDYPDHLIAVDAATNRSKGDRDPAEWIPPDESYVCDYLDDWLRIKSDWGLTVDQDEFTAIQEAIEAYVCN
jgi:hypothetical protein